MGHDFTLKEGPTQDQNPSCSLHLLTTSLLFSTLSHKLSYNLFTFSQPHLLL
ncbi:unnamed protein product [Spirodela intermedia]|uniref:Uncharacterized protein n=1 Tax=Spirodela intermedia TaxID=51605 RepID=A0A7I8JU83_SPIIN|nr:unnamed protein product [Spirodela intermedia]CAA6673767.1 unnamed protein product [Spirodela intermedia]